MQINQNTNVYPESLQDSNNNDPENGSHVNCCTDSNNSSSKCNINPFYFIFGWMYDDDEIPDGFIDRFWILYVPFFVISVIIIVTCVTMSFWYVPYYNYALRRNTYHGVALNDLYEEGRYFLTLDNSLIYFPSTYNEITFNSKTFAENGLEFDCYVTFYYKLPKDNVGKIYDSYSTAYETRVVNNAKQIAKNVASTFSVDDFLTNRTYIETSIANVLEKYLKDTVYVEAPAEYFKIVNIIFPATLIDKSLETAIALQNNEIQEFQQQVNIIEADTNKLKAEIDAETKRTLEYANNLAYQMVTNSQSESTKILSVARSNGIKQVCENINLQDSNDVNKLTNVFAVMDNANNFTMLNDVKGGVLLHT